MYNAKIAQFHNTAKQPHSNSNANKNSRHAMTCLLFNKSCISLHENLFTIRSNIDTILLRIQNSHTIQII